MKNLKYLLFIIPFLFLNNVKAETKEFEYLVRSSSSDVVFNSYADSSTILSSPYTQSFINEGIDSIVSYWETKFKSKYPYYFISISDFYPLFNSNSYYFDFAIYLNCFTSIPSSLDSFKALSDDDFNTIYYTIIKYYQDGLPKTDGFWYGNSFDNEYMFYTRPSDPIELYYLPYFYYDSNYDQPFGLDDTYVVKKGDEVLFTLNKQDIIPTYKSKFINKTDLNYTEIDLNNYPYVALSLKDYSKTEEFNSMTYVKGQYCLTPVYNYGLTERKDILSGTQIQRCSLYYDEYTPIRTYILKSDLENHSIYYLKAYDTSKENKIKVDTSVFNIHYITEEEKDNPIITIDGKKYSTIPYNELTDTATKSEDENYVSGGSCAVGDFNCTASLVGSNVSWSDIFTSPLDFLKKIWSSITQVFVIITYFIALLPTTLQYFFYISFTLAIILGIIKIIL